MTNSSHIAKLLGPTLIALSITEWMNLDVFVGAIGPSFGPHVSLNGSLVALLVIGVVLTFKAYGGAGNSRGPSPL